MAGALEAVDACERVHTRLLDWGAITQHLMAVRPCGYVGLFCGSQFHLFHPYFVLDGEE